jgi:hypothetical protein
MAVSALAFCGGAAWYFWPKKEGPTGGETADLDRKISFNCYNSVRPTHFREDRPLYMVQIIQPPDTDRPPYTSIGNTFFAQGNNEIKWTDDFPSLIKKCTLTNYSDAPIFRVSVPLAVEWIEAIGTAPGNTRSGNVIRSAEAPSPSFDLGTGNRNEDYFYIVNLTDLYVRIKIPDTATVYLANSDAAHKAQLIPATSPFPPDITLFPRVPPAKGPPTGDPPVPMPPSRPKGK